MLGKSPRRPPAPLRGELSQVFPPPRQKSIDVRQKTGYGRWMLRGVTGVVLTGAAVLLAPAVAAADPTGTVAGWRSPVAGAMTLTISAVPDGAALSSASVTLGGVPVGSAPFAS